MNIDQAKQIDFPSLLARVGARENIQANRQGQWFFSPFREEDTASFKIWQQDSGLWCWKDFGSGEGGNVIAFANRMIGRKTNDRAISDALKWLESINGGRVANDTKQRTQTPATPRISTIEEDRFTLIDNKKLHNPQLCNYMNGRGIPAHYAQLHCGQANYFDNVTKKKFYGISFPNIDSGLEIRAATEYKHYVNTGPKNFSFVPGQDKAAHNIAVFEGFIDFLSYLVLTRQDKPRCPTIVLNSVSFTRNATDYIVKHSQGRHVQTYFDHDVAGQKAYDTFYEILEPQGFNVTDERYLYEGHHDVNAFLKDTSSVEHARFINTPAPTRSYDTSASAEARRNHDARLSKNSPKLF